MTVSRRDEAANAAAEARRLHGLRPGLPGLQDLMDRLLAPDGCPWDREQSLETLRHYLLEETHEVLEAMGDPDSHREELGDLLFQIVFQAALRERSADFRLDDVVDAILAKMVRRHPHVFRTPAAEGAAAAGAPLTAADVAGAWELRKQRERAGTGSGGDAGAPGVLRGVPRSLPALARAFRLQDKAAAVGFDWPDVEGVLAKFDEEWAELAAARQGGSAAERAEELGDVLFVLVRLAAKLGVDPEDALRATNAKFERRFAAVEAACQAAGITPESAGLAQLDHLWQAVKRQERAESSSGRP